MLPITLESDKPVVQLNLKGKLWTPGSKVHVIAGTDVEAEEAVGFKKDAKRQTVHVSVQHEAVMETLQKLAVIPKDVANASTLKKREEIIAACNFAEDRGYAAFVNLGRMVLAVEEGKAAEHPLTVKIGDIWDRTEYGDTPSGTAEELNKSLQQKLKDAYDAWEQVENDWDDERGDAPKAKNASAIKKWVYDHTLILTEATRRLHHWVNLKRKSEEQVDETPKYQTLGAAIKANDEDSFLNLLRRQKYDMAKKEDAEIVQKLFPHVVEANMMNATRVLAKMGVDTAGLDRSGQNLFAQAVVKGNFEMATTLQKIGVSTTSRDFGGDSVLVLAVKSGNLEAVKFSVEKMGKDAKNTQDGINTSCLLGYTPLAYAVSESNVELVRYLLEKGADPTHRVIGEDDASMDEFTDVPEIETVLAEACQQWSRAKKSP